MIPPMYNLCIDCIVFVICWFAHSLAYSPSSSIFIFISNSDDVQVIYWNEEMVLHVSI